MQLTKSLLHTTDAYIKRLHEAGIETVSDLLSYFPRDIEDKSDICERFSEVNITEKVVIKCKIELLTSETTRNSKLLIKAVLVDRDGSYAEAIWFNRKFLLQQFAIGDTVIIYGKAKYEYGRLTFPSCEIEHMKVGRREIVPIYSDLNYIPGVWIREKIGLLKLFLTEYFHDIIPIEIRIKHGFRTKIENVRSIHFPSSIEDFQRSRQELGYEELYIFQKRGLDKKYALERESLGFAPQLTLDIDIMKSLIASLPFPLTNKQRIVLFQILKDMERPHAMARMLQGDVGTGKTVVALLASVHAILVARKRFFGLPLEKGGRRDLDSEKIYEREIGFREYNPNNKESARSLRNNTTEAEKKLWLFLKQQHETWNRQKPIEQFIVDFYCSKYDLVIEVDGTTHGTEEEIRYDVHRTEVLKSFGLTVVRFTNEEVYKSYEGVCERIIEVIGKMEQNPPNPLYQGGMISHFLSGSEAGLQVAIMAPTEILARQHFSGQEAWLSHWGISSDLIVGSLTPRLKIDARSRLASGQTDIIFGTHALIQDSVSFARLGFVVVDEQHRFGVEQRKILEEYCSVDLLEKRGAEERGGGSAVSEKSDNQSSVTSGQLPESIPESSSLQGSGQALSQGAIVPHRLNMSATPIPRSLALTLYGDQDISVLDEYPAGRLPIHTRVVKEEKREEVYRWVSEQVRSGRQVYWISPLVEESDTLDIASATDMQVVLSGVFPQFSIGLIHGKMSGKEKDRIMQEFYENKIQILSSTSVVEVGVNNPNATIMCIEAAERFGLSQLHQFRGRVGRGEHQSYCYLFTTKEYKTDRLKAMEETNDGFELAQIDLDLRGPGEVYGVRQSGVPDMQFADLRDTDLIAEIREDIEEWMQSKK